MPRGNTKKDEKMPLICKGYLAGAAIGGIGGGPIGAIICGAAGLLGGLIMDEANQQRGSGLNNIGLQAYEKGDHVKAFENFTEAAKLGYFMGSRNVGFLFERGQTGQGFSTDLVKAQEWYQKAITIGNEAEKEFVKKDLDRVQAIWDGHTSYERQEYATALAAYEKARTMGSVEAFRHLGMLHQLGHGVEQNFVTAAMYYQQAVKDGYEPAQEELDRLLNNPVLTAQTLNSIGVMYYDGKNVSRDYQKAFNWFSKAKEKGEMGGVSAAHACYNIGLSYGNGLVGGKDLAKAAEHYLLAAKGGYRAEAEEKLRELFKNITANALNAIQITANDLNAIQIIVPHFMQQNEQTSLLSFKTNNKQTLLHFACVNGWRGIAEKLIQVAIETNGIEEYMLARDLQGKTALMLAVANEHQALIPLLTGPVVQERMKYPLDHVSNNDLFAAIEIKQGGVNAGALAAVNPAPQTTEVVVAQEYLENGLTDQRALQVHRIFKPQQFELVMTKYKNDIATCGDERQRETLCREAIQRALAKYKYDQAAAICANEPKALAVDKSSKAETITNILQNLLNKNLVQHLGKYSSYSDEIRLFLNFIQELASNNVTNVGGMIGNFVDKHSDSYIAVLGIALDSYDALKNKKYDQLFRPIIMLIQFFAHKFGGEREKKLAQHLFNLLDELSIRSDDEKTFLTKTRKFYIKLKEPAAKCAIEILGCKKAITESMMQMKSHVESNNIPAAKAHFSKLITRILNLRRFKFYSEEMSLESVAAIVASSDIDIRDMVKQEGYVQFKSIIKILRQVVAKFSSERLEKTVIFLNRFVDELCELQRKQQTAKIVIYLKLFLRVLIDYATMYKNKTLSYVGVVGLGITQLFDVHHAIRSEDSILTRTSMISREFVKFLRDTSEVIQIRQINGLRVWAVIANALIHVVENILNEEKVDSTACLKAMKRFIDVANADIDSFLLHDSNDEVLKAAKKYFSIVRTCIVAGDAVKVVYDIFNGNALKALRDNLRKYLPEGISSAVETGLLTALQGLPVAGGIVATLNVTAEIHAVEKNITAYIKKEAQNICHQMNEMKLQLSNQMHAGFTVLDHHIAEMECRIKCQLEDLKQILLKLEEMAIQHKKTLIDLTLVNSIVDHNKSMEMEIKSKNTEIHILKNLYKQSLMYLLPGGTGVYSQYFEMNWLVPLFQFTSAKHQAFNNVVLPDFNMWLKTISTLIKFIAYLQERNLFSHQPYYIDSLLKVFSHSIDIIRFLKYLVTQEFITDMFSIVRTKEVDLHHLYVFGCYCSLIGVPLVGFGEDVKFWYSDADVYLIWREEMVHNLLQIIQTSPKQTVISDAINATNHVILSLGYLLMSVSKQSQVNDHFKIKADVAQKLYEVYGSEMQASSKEDFYFLDQPPETALSDSITQTLMPPPKKMVTVQRKESQSLDQAPGSEPNLVR